MSSNQAVILKSFLTELSRLDSFKYAKEQLKQFDKQLVEGALKEELKLSIDVLELQLLPVISSDNLNFLKGWIDKQIDGIDQVIKHTKQKYPTIKQFDNGKHLIPIVTTTKLTIGIEDCAPHINKCYLVLAPKLIPITKPVKTTKRRAPSKKASLKSSAIDGKPNKPPPAKKGNSIKIKAKSKAKTKSKSKTEAKIDNKSNDFKDFKDFKDVKDIKINNNNISANVDIDTNDNVKIQQQINNPTEAKADVIINVDVKNNVKPEAKIDTKIDAEMNNNLTISDSNADVEDNAKVNAKANVKTKAKSKYKSKCKVNIKPRVKKAIIIASKKRSPGDNNDNDLNNNNELVNDSIDYNIINKIDLNNLNDGNPQTSIDTNAVASDFDINVQVEKDIDKFVKEPIKKLSPEEKEKLIDLKFHEIFMRNLANNSMNIMYFNACFFYCETINDFSDGIEVKPTVELNARVTDRIEFNVLGDNYACFKRCQTSILEEFKVLIKENKLSANPRLKLSEYLEYHVKMFIKHKIFDFLKRMGFHCDEVAISCIDYLYEHQKLDLKTDVKNIDRINLELD